MMIGLIRRVFLGEQYLLYKGLKLFRKVGEAMVIKEIKQLHDRVCFEPIDPSNMTQDERKNQ